MLNHFLHTNRYFCIRLAVALTLLIACVSLAAFVVNNVGTLAGLFTFMVSMFVSDIIVDRI